MHRMRTMVYDNNSDDVELCEECYTEALKRLQDDYKVFIDKYDETDTAILEDYLASKYY